MSNAVEMKEVCKIKSANKNANADLRIEKTGEIIAKGVGGKIIKLKNVLYSKNLLSIRKLINKGVSATLTDKEIKLINQKNNEGGKYDDKFWWLNLELVNKINSDKNVFSCNEVQFYS